MMSKGSHGDVIPLSLTQLDGCWDLLSWSTVTANGAVAYPYSEAARGRIIFDIPSRRMSAFLMHPEWQNSKGEQRMFLAYSAAIELAAIEPTTVELTADTQPAAVLLHHVDFASNPRMIGETLRRNATLDGDVLTLKTLTTVGREPKDGQHTLVWRRAVT